MSVQRVSASARTVGHAVTVVFRAEGPGSGSSADTC